MTMADTIAVMNAGRIEQLGDPATLYEQPALDVRRELPRPVQPAARPGSPVGDGDGRSPSTSTARGCCVAGRPASPAALKATSGSACAPRSCASARRPGRNRLASARSPTCPSPAWRRSTSCGCRGARRRGRRSRTTGRPRARARREVTARRGGRARRSRSTAAQDDDAGVEEARGRWLSSPALARGGTAAAEARAPRQLGALRAARAGPAVAARLLRRADVHAGVAVAAGGLGRDRLHLHGQRRHLRRRARSATGRTCCARSGTPPPRRSLALAARLPAGVLHGAEGGPLEEHHARPRHRAVLHELPHPHAGVAHDPLRHRPGHRDRPGAALHRPPAGRRPDEQRHAAVVEVRGHRGPDVQLPAVHDPAAVRGARAARPSPRRGGGRPLRLAVPGVPARHAGRCRCPASWPARC